MKRSPREQKIYLLSILFAAAPFAFALVRALQTGDDLRLLWMAFASYIGASVVMVIGKARSRKPNVALAFSAVVLLIATLLAGATAFMLGATASPGIWAVAFFFGICWAVSCALGILSRPRPI